MLTKYPLFAKLTKAFNIHTCISFKYEQNINIIILTVFSNPTAAYLEFYLFHEKCHLIV